MEEAAAGEWGRQNARVASAREKHAGDPKKLEEELAKLRQGFARRPGGTHFESLVTGRVGQQSWNYNNAKFAWAPTLERPAQVPGAGAPGFDHVAIVPRGQGLLVELGERLPEQGTLRVRVLASRAQSVSPDEPNSRPSPSLRLDFGWQASNDSRAVVRVSERDLLVDAAPGSPVTTMKSPLPT